MRKNILFVIFMAFTAVAIAQNGESVKYGFRTGLNYSSLEGDNINLDSRIGFHASFFADIMLGSKFSLTPEIGLSALGARADEIRIESGDKVNLKTSWLQVGVLGKINLSPKLFLQVGPQVGVNVGERDNNDYYNYDVLGAAGLGYNLNENFTLDLRYGFGLSNVFDREFGDLNDASNRYFQLGISYKL